MERDVLHGHVLTGQGGMASNRKRFRLHIRKKYIYCEGGGALEEVVNRSCGFLIPGSVEVNVR